MTMRACTPVVVHILLFAKQTTVVVLMTLRVYTYAKSDRVDDAVVHSTRSDRIENRF